MIMTELEWMGKIKTSITGVFIIFLIVGSCLLLFVTRQSEAEGNSIYVDVNYLWPDGDGSANRPYRSIQYAIDIAEEGDVIYIFEGTYNETLQINKRISIVGLDRDNVTIEKKGARFDSIIKITADHVVLEDFTISDTTSQNRVALIFISADYATIEGVNITISDTWGIYLHYSDDNTIGNIIINNTKGIYSYYSNNNVFSNNNIGNCSEAAFKIINSNNNIIYGNGLNYSKYGLYATSSSNNNITGNRVNNVSYHGLKLIGGTENTVKNNYIDYCANGLDFSSSDSTIMGNKFDRNQIGINLAGSNNQIKNNFINNSDIWGIYTTSASRNNIIYQNYFIYNAVNAKEIGNNQWYHDNLTKGNYWHDYNEVDANLDGIGDVPYQVSGGKEDLYPLGKFLKPPEKPTDPFPEDEQDEVGLSVTLKVTVSDPDSEKLDVFFYRASDDKLYGKDYSVPSGEEASCSFSLPFETTFLWYAIVTDGKLENRSDIWIFITRQIPPLNKKPVADPGRPYYAMIGEEITLDGSGSEDPDGEIEFYRWNFGDGSSEILAISPKHTYYDPGTYTVTLTVVDNDGRSSTEQTTATISTTPITNYLPFADPGGPYSAEVGESITFNGTGSEDTDGTVITYSWTFGDDTNSSGVLVSHTYSNDGTYLVELTVTDDDGASHSSSVIVTIDPKSGIPGFELIIVIFAIMSIFLYNKRKR